MALKAIKTEKRLLTEEAWSEYLAANPVDWSVSPDEENDDTILQGELEQVCVN